MNDDTAAQTLFNEGLAAHQKGELQLAMTRYQGSLALKGDNPEAFHLWGVAAYQTGEIKTAVELINKAIELDDTKAAFYNNLSAALQAAGHMQEAEKPLLIAIQLDPTSLDAYANLGIVYERLQRFPEARGVLEKALVIDPGNAVVLNNLSNVMKASGDMAGAQKTLLDALEKGGKDGPYAVPLFTNLSDTYRQMGMLAEAEEAVKQALTRNEKDPDALNNAGLLFQATGRLPEAEFAFRKALEVTPDNGLVLNNLGSLLLRMGRPGDAAQPLFHALRKGFDLPEINTNLGLAFLGTKHFDKAEMVLSRAVELNEKYAPAWSALGDAFIKQQKMVEARKAWETTLELAPETAEAHFGLGSLAARSGDSETALIKFRKALEISPDNPAIHSNLLMAMHYADTPGKQDFFDAHVAWADKHAPLTKERPAIKDADPERKLKVGFISSNFRFHAVGAFMLGMLEAKPENANWEAWLYYTNTSMDTTTQAFKAAADTWRDVPLESDEALAQLIEQDEIDILIDLHGHTKGRVLGVFAHRPAPVQAAWLDYVDTTGLAAMDYLICDGTQIPQEDDGFYREKVVRLPVDYISYSPPSYAPDVSTPPNEMHGHVTFGCFNSVQKVTPIVISTWANILKLSPDSRLVMNSFELANDFVRARFNTLFQAFGIAEDRYDLLPGAQHAEFLEHYRHIDIALDPFPYSGGLNTCEALWMGVPVVTWTGERFCSRHASVHLQAAGLPEFVMPDTDSYVTKAVELAADPAALTELRKGLRDKVAASPLCDHVAFQGHFTTALREMWQETLKE